MTEPHTKKLTTTNVALISIFSALWVALNLTVAPLGFALLHLPVIHSIIIFVMLILVVWATGQYGAASLVSIIGSVIVVFANPSVAPVLGFVPAALIFDLILLVNHHRVNKKPINIGVAVLASILCAYVAALVNGLLILNLAWMFTLTIWAGWNILGALIGAAIILPIIAALEKANVRKIKAE